MVQDEQDNSIPGRLSDLAVGRRLLSALIRDDLDIAIEPDLPRISDYLLVRRLGAGGGGEVYYGVRKGSDQPLAIKLLRSGSGDRRRAQRAWRELETLMQLRAPSVPRVHDYGIHEGRLYITTDYIEGLTLDQHCTTNELDRRARVHLLAMLADAVQALHERGVIHRDLKPTNVIVDVCGQPVIIDLGIAHLLTEQPGHSLTETGAPIGSPAFMAPEQARGEGGTSTRSDVYSLGATACFILTGKTPHETDVPLHEAVRRVAQDFPREPRRLDPTLPKPLAMVLTKALSPESNQRYATATEFAADLRRWLSGEPITWTRPSLVVRARFWARKNPGVALSGATAIIALGAAVIFGSVAVANASIAEERAELVKQRDVENAQLQMLRDQLGQQLSETKAKEQTYLARVESLKKTARRFVTSARVLADEGSITEAMRVLVGLTHLIEPGGIDDPEIVEDFIAMRLDAIMRTLEVVYPRTTYTDRQGLQHVRLLLEAIERERMLKVDEDPNSLSIGQ